MPISLLPALASWTVVGIVTGLVLGVGFSVMSMSPPAFVMAKICFTVAAVLFFSKVGFWLASAKSGTAERLLLTVVICGIGGVCWVELFRWVDNRRHSEDTTPSISNEKPPTLTDLFKSSFPNTLRVDGSTWGLMKGETQVLTGPTKVYLDFDARTKFIAFYVPTSEHSYEAALNLWSQVQAAFESVQKQVEVQAGYQQNMTDLKDLTFSGRVFIYHEDMFNLRQLADLVDTYKSHGMALDFRGPNFLGDQVVAWHHQHDAKGAK